MAGLAASFGSGAMTNAVSELEISDTIFIIGSNTATSHPLVATRIFRAIENGAKVIVADPRKNQIADFAHLYVRHNPGTDVALLNAMMKAILDKGLEDKDFIAENTEEFEGFKQLIDTVSLEESSNICGVSVEDIKALAEAYAKADKASIVYCMGITQHTTGVDNVKSLANLSMLTGNIGKLGTGVNPLRGQNNVQGACDMGGLPNVYTGYQPVTLGDANKKFSQAWGVDFLPSNIGLTIPEMLAGIENDEVKALWVMGENPVVSDPDANHVVKALEKVELLIVQDIFLTPTAKLADVVLPGVSFAEKDGTFVNTERRVTRVRKAVDPVGESRQDWEIIQEISNRFGFEMAYESPEDIFNEIASLTPSYAGITYERLEGPGLQWPCPSKDHPGTPFLHKDGKFTRGKGLFHAISYIPPNEVANDEYPFLMTTGRVYAHYHTGTMTRNSESLDFEAREGFLEINPVDAQTLDICDGQKIKMASRRGEIETKIMVTERVSPGLVFMPFHFEEANVNKLTNPAYDPIAKIPEFKVCAVKLEKA
ncbi:formate dehydrogenase, alpha subunit [Desulfobacula phenolica]|uniref:nitrate reductase (cytochrome) n=1 Tax=Desulfobacula phenolica TaxID=90732 RepID=A0A1H2DMA3_9BACT|nr:formate dehydrogenase, alpha subunit [Desulfobacula phenolica]